MQVMFIKHDHYYRHGLHSEKYLECIVKNSRSGRKKFSWSNNVNSMHRLCPFLFQGIQFLSVDALPSGKHVVLGTREGQ